MTKALAHGPGLELERTSNEPSGARQLRLPRTLPCFQTAEDLLLADVLKD